MRIQHNILAMNAYRNYNTNTSALAKNLEKLSSGYKINRAGDDAAGLAISEKMRAQITGLNAAQKNVKDGISLVKTAEGAMQEIQDMLNRMDYLATQSANGTYDNEVDRKNLQKEVDALKTEINRIAKSANFNGIKLLDGSQEATSTFEKALGELLADQNIDGTSASVAGKAKVEFTMGTAAGASNPNQFEAVAGVGTDGTWANTDATKAKFEFTTVANGTNNGETTIGTLKIDGDTTIGDLGKITLGGGKTVMDLFDVTVGANPVTDWTDGTGGAAGSNATALGDGVKVTLTAKATGDLGSTVNTALNTAKASSTLASYTEGKNVGGGTGAKAASYDFQVTVANLQGGQKIELGGKTLEITADPTKTTGDGTLVLSGDATTDLASLETALSQTFTDFTVTNKGTGAFTLTAKNADETGNQGALRFYDSTNTALGSNVVNYNRYTPAVAGSASKYATATYTIDAADLKDGAELRFGGDSGTVIKIIADGKTAGANEINESQFATKLAEVLEKSGYAGGKVDYTAGKLVVTSTNKANEGGADFVAGAGKVELKKAPAAPAAAITASDGTNTITTGTTTLKNLKDLYGDTYDVKVETGSTNQTSDTYVIAAGDKITLTAKVAGKMGDNHVSFTGVSQTRTDGWDEGFSGGGRTTHYDISFDLTKLAGGQSFTFGNVNGSTKTFEFTLDSGTGADTDNGTIGSDGTEVANRVLIDLSGVDFNDKEAVADAIKNAVSGGIGGSDWNYKTSVNGNTIKLEMDATTGKDATNMGNVRYTAAGGGITSANYTPYVDTSNTTPGTYAQVTWDLDISKLKAGDTLTIGGTSVTIGTENKVEMSSNNSTVEKVTLKESDVTAQKLIEAFETAGYQSGRLQFSADGKKVTITGIQAGQKAANLADNGGKVEFTTTRDTKGTTGGLTLQIGDTSDDFNQMTLSIGSMETEALGIDDLDISKIEDAQNAIQTIKDAINNVSSVRGDLGAVQNRLEHTANNLSVMAENIQDAESTIRDTDIAEEMMSYTKNNILIQSAQAMLAQANAVPQGVLQLLG